MRLIQVVAVAALMMAGMLITDTPVGAETPTQEKFPTWSETENPHPSHGWVIGHVVGDNAATRREVDYSAPRKSQGSFRFRDGQPYYRPAESSTYQRSSAQQMSAILQTHTYTSRRATEFTPWYRYPSGQFVGTTSRHLGHEYQSYWKGRRLFRH